MMTKRSLLLPLMTMFDFADTTQPCAQRNVSIVAPQALALLNNDFVHEQSDAFAERVEQRSGRRRDGAGRAGLVAGACRSAARRGAAGGTCAPEVAGRSVRRRGQIADTSRQAAVQRVGRGASGPGVVVPRAVEHQRVHLCRLNAAAQLDSDRLAARSGTRALFPCGMTRREFVWEMGGGFVGLALVEPAGRRRILRAPRPARANPSSRAIRSRPSRRTSRPRRKSCIFLMMNGGPSHVDTFDYKPSAGEVRRPAAAGRQEVHQLRRPQDGLPHAGLAPVPPRRPERADDLRLLPQGPRACRQAGPDPLVPHRQPRPRLGPGGHEHRQHVHRPAVAGQLGRVRPGHREPEPARLRGASWTSAAGRSAGSPTGPAASCRPAIQGTLFRPVGEPVLDLRGPAHRPRSPARAARSAGQAEPAASRRAARRRGAGRADSTATSWPSACRPKRPRRSIWRRKTSRRSTCTAWAGSRPTSSAATAWSPGGWSSAACGSCSFTPAAATWKTPGTRTRASRRTTAGTAPKSISRSPRC